LNKLIYFLKIYVSNLTISMYRAATLRIKVDRSITRLQRQRASLREIRTDGITSLWTWKEKITGRVARIFLISKCSLKT